MLRRSFLELPIFSFLGFKLKDKIEPKFEVKQEDPEIWVRPYCERFELEEESFKIAEKSVLNWLKNTKKPTFEIAVARSDSKLHWITFVRSVINIKSAYNTWEQWHIATCDIYPKIISIRIKDVGTNNTKLIDDGFTMPNEIRTERYDETSYV
jgi:hypothetical protein